MNGLLNPTFKRTITRQLIDEGYIGDDFFHDEYYKDRGELREFGQKFFSLYYEIDSLSTSKRVIKCKDILSKCVLIDTVDKKLLVDYLYEREHD